MPKPPSCATAVSSVARNTPYAGGHSTVLYGVSPARRQALLVEINRALYLDEDRNAKRPSFDMVRVRLTRAIQSLVAVPVSMGRPGTLAEAAE